LAIRVKVLIVQNDSLFKNKLKQVAGAGFGAQSGGRKNITHRKQTEKQKLNMATMATKYL